MNIKKHIRNTAFAVAVAIGTGGIVFAANTYSDVPATHWAYSAITKVADKGIMVGDGTSYNPAQVIDKLEASRILARVAGYNTANGYNPAEKTTNTINLFKKAFPVKWGTINKDYENCISYLYEKEIITMDDLNKFVVKYTDGTEKIKELTREEMAVFLVKTMGKKNDAVSYKGSYKFSDDSSISETAKPYVYYLKELGVVSGDNNGAFNPTNSITKAEMAVFLDRAIYSKSAVDITIGNNNNSSNSNNTNNNNINSNNTNNNNNVTAPTKMNVTSDEGKIATVYASSKVISITPKSGAIKVYRLADNVKIYVDGFLSTIDKLATDMPVVVVAINNDATEIRAQKVTVPITGEVDTNNNNTNTNNNINNNTNTNMPIDNSQFVTRVCTVSATGSINNSKTISVVIQMLNPSGDVFSEEHTYLLTDNCTVRKGNKDVALSTIEKNDIVTIKISGNNVYSIDVEEKNMSIKEAELIDKRLNDNNVPILTIKTKEGTKYDLKVTSSSDIRRKGEGEVKWKELRIGDTLEVDKEYNNITYLYAVGDTSTVEGWVESVVISDYSSIILKDKYGEKTKYSVFSPGDLYSVTLGSKVRLTLDSKEVASIRILSAASSSSSIQGIIDKVKYDYMYIDNNDNTSVKVAFNVNTTVYDMTTNRSVNVDELLPDMHVSVIFTNDSDKIAKTITIISR